MKVQCDLEVLTLTTLKHFLKYKPWRPTGYFQLEIIIAYISYLALSTSFE